MISVSYLSARFSALALVALVFIPGLHAEEVGSSQGTLGASEPLRPPSRITIFPYLGASLFELKGDIGTSKASLNQRGMGGIGIEVGKGRVRFESGLGVLQSGTAGNGKAGILPFNFQLRSNFITLPLLAKIHFFSDTFSSAFLKLGFTAAYLAQSDFEVAALGRSATEDVRNKANNYDWLLTAGFGGRFYLSQSWDWILDTTFYRGQVDATKAEGKSVYQGFTLSTGLAYRLPDE